MTRKLPPFSIDAKSIVIGKFYKHYKGPKYKVLYISRHSETLEELVIYEDREGEIWARPLKMFIENITSNGKTLPRFERTSD